MYIDFEVMHYSTEPGNNIMFATISYLTNDPTHQEVQDHAKTKKEEKNH